MFKSILSTGNIDQKSQMSKTHQASGVWNRGRSLDNMYEVNGQMLNNEEFKKFVNDIE